MNTLSRHKVLFVALGTTIIAGVAYLLFGSILSKSVQYQFVQLKNGDVEYLISSSGTLNPVTEITVGTQVSGTIVKVLVDFNDKVRKGQVIAVLDSAVLRMAVDEAQSGMIKAQATLAEEQSIYKRSKILSDSGYFSTSEFQTVNTSYRDAQAGMISARTALERAKKNLNYAIVRSPIDGTVTARNVEEGQTVAASFSTPTLFTIAQDLSKMEIKASVDESDIGQIKDGQAVRFTVQAYPDKVFQGVVEQIRVEPTTTANVVNYIVVISADNKDNLLLPGMTTTIDFIIDHKTNVLLIPNAALRFQPADKDIAAAQGRTQASPSPVPQDTLNRGQRHVTASAGTASEWKRMWYLDKNGNLTAALIQPGLSDGINTEILGNLYSVGMNVIVGTQNPGAAAATPKPNSTTGGIPRRML